MSAPRRPWTQRILDDLGDREWHTYDELVAAAGELVPPGQARRRAETNRRHGKSRTGAPAPAARKIDGDMLAFGRRAIVVQAIQVLRRGGHVETVDGHARLIGGAAARAVLEGNQQ